VGSGTEEERDGWLPGMTRKPLDLNRIAVVRTKHVRKLRGKGTIRAYHRNKEDIYVEEYEDLINHPERVRQWLPTLCKNELVIQREIEGDWKESKKFIASRVSLRTLLEEEPDIELAKE
jgi:hypothetical protein